MNKYTYFKILSVMLVSSLYVGCSDSFLELDNPNGITDQTFWQTEKDLESGLATVYKALSENSDGSYYQRTNPQLVEGRTENFTVATDVVGRYNIGTFISTMSDWQIATLYNWCYRGIFRANQVIHYSNQIKNIDENKKNQFVAEAKFLRALNYFNLANEWGAVPIVTTLAESSDDYFKPKSPIEEVWQQVATDLQEAAPHLPISYPADQAGRITNGAAIAFLGKAYLYQEKWDQAITEFEKLVLNEAKYGYDLMEDYAHNFDGLHENNKESIFEIQYSRLRPDVWGGKGATSTVIAQEIAGPKIGWQEIRPTKTLLEAFLKEKTAEGDFDPRATATIVWNYPGAMYYQKPFLELYADTAVWTKKYQNWWNENEGDYRSALNEHVMRYADVLLMLAEAYTMKGDVAKAAPLVQRIRNRAKLVNKESEMKAWTKEVMMKEIQHQRNLEFVREMLHWFDLRRWGLLEETLRLSKVEGWQNYSPKFQYYPIPESELNNNPALTQNDPW